MSQYKCGWIQLSKVLLNTSICADQGIVPNTMSELPA